MNDTRDLTFEQADARDAERIIAIFILKQPSWTKPLDEPGWKKIRHRYTFLWENPNARNNLAQWLAWNALEHLRRLKKRHIHQNRRIFAVHHYAQAFLLSDIDFRTRMYAVRRFVESDFSVFPHMLCIAWEQFSIDELSFRKNLLEGYTEAIQVTLTPRQRCRIMQAKTRQTFFKRLERLT